jgi:hypothetical protein
METIEFQWERNSICEQAKAEGNILRRERGMKTGECLHSDTLVLPVFEKVVGIRRDRYPFLMTNAAGRYIWIFVMKTRANLHKTIPFANPVTKWSKRVIRPYNKPIAQRKFWLGIATTFENV